MICEGLISSIFLSDILTIIYPKCSRPKWWSAPSVHYILFGLLCLL